MKPAVAILLVLAAAPALAADPGDGARYRACLETASREPDVAIPEATKWLGAGGGVPARHCLALAYLAKRDYGPAVLTLEAAARAAEAAHDVHAPELWAQAGNAALAGNDAARALGYLTTALEGAARPEDKAEVLIDRARAQLELKHDPAARADLSEAIRIAPANPYAWLLRGTLARRDGDLKVAETDILEAARLAPSDPDVALESGNVAAAQGRLDLARRAWTAAAAAAPGSPAATAANAALAANPATP